MLSVAVTEILANVILKRPVMVLGGIGDSQYIASSKALAGMDHYDINLACDLTKVSMDWIDRNVNSMPPKYVIRYTNVNNADPQWWAHILQQVVERKHPVVIVGYRPQSYGEIFLPLADRCVIVTV
jgi:hypothetical protein